MALTKKEKTQLESVLINTQENCRDLKFLLNDMAVNGASGIENILRQDHNTILAHGKKIDELMSATVTLRKKNRLREDIKRVAHSFASIARSTPWMVALWKLLTNRYTLMLLITIILTLLGLEDVAKRIF